MKRLREKDYKRVSDLIGDDYKYWSSKENVLIDCPTGRGKTTFVLEVLAKYADKKKKKILFLVNRTSIKDSVQNKIRKMKINNVMVMTYQTIESSYTLKNTMSDLADDYAYIVADEAHHFFADSEFNNMTESSLRWINEQNKQNSIIYMSATCYMLKEYFRVQKINIKSYELKANYDYIDEFYFYEDQSVIENIIRNIHPNEKVLYFTYAYRANKLADENLEVDFICSPRNKTYKCDKTLLDEIISNEKFPNKVLATTTFLDAGVNINDSAVKHVIIDVGINLDSIQQCLGRKRINFTSDKIKLYVSNPSSYSLEQTLKDCNELLDPVEYFKEHGFNIYSRKYYNHPFNKLFRPINGEIVISTTLGMRYAFDRFNIKKWLRGESSFRLDLEKRLGIEADDFRTERANYVERSFVDYIEKYINIELRKDEQLALRKDLTNLIGKEICPRSGDATMPSIKTFLRTCPVNVMLTSESRGSRANRHTVWIFKKGVQKT